MKLQKFVFVIGLFFFIAPNLSFAVGENCMYNPPYTSNYQVEREYFFPNTLAITGSPVTEVFWCTTAGSYADDPTVNGVHWNPHVCFPSNFGNFTLSVLVSVQAPASDIKGKGWSKCNQNNN